MQQDFGSFHPKFTQRREGFVPEQQQQQQQQQKQQKLTKKHDFSHSGSVNWVLQE